jgi:hypothetical protein
MLHQALKCSERTPAGFYAGGLVIVCVVFLVLHGHSY